jgi:hypothetical protein
MACLLLIKNLGVDFLLIMFDFFILSVMNLTEILSIFYIVERCMYGKYYTLEYQNEELKLINILRCLLLK